LATGYSLFKFQIINLLSLPPLANYYPSNDHLRPQTSYLWPICLWIIFCLTLKSLLKIILSLDPVLKIEPFHAIELILPWWSPRVLIIFPWLISLISVFPLSVPTARWPPLLLHPTLVILLSNPASHNFLTYDVQALHMYTALLSPTAKIF